MLKASRNSDVRTEYATGVSFSAVAMRPPASELAATKPTSDCALTLNGSSLTVFSSLVPVDEVGAAWAPSLGRPRLRTAAAVVIMDRTWVRFMFGVGLVIWSGANPGTKHPRTSAGNIPDVSAQNQTMRRYLTDERAGTYR